jgi:NAD(P)-dependent dehydrogenase (short-subunit alcohol dehydrogenase family)
VTLLQDKTAFVTGGSAGIGRAIVEAYLAEGARVVVGSRNPEVGQKLLDELAAGDALHFVPTDVTRQGDVEALADQTVELLGGLDIAVLNAGGVGTSAPIMKMSDEEWRFELDINLNHTFWGMRQALRHMTERGSGRVITMSSIEGKHAKAGVAGYVANKHAINGLTKAAAKEVGPSGITVNAICPGLVLTDLPKSKDGKGLGVGSFQAVVDLYSREAALQRTVTVEEVAAAAVFLASDAASGITGTLLSVDGGTAHY